MKFKYCITKCIFECAMKVLELYSGIGGMHLALRASGVEGEVVASIDINPTANTVYKHNFPNTLLLNRNIQSLTSNYINKFKVNTILMSPPCQPFTRNGLKEDINDARTQSFIHILEILPELHIEFILIENVKGFEDSEMRNILRKALQSAGFLFQEFILSPTHFKVPNMRHRYYCIARKAKKFQIENGGSVLETLPNELLKNEEFYTISEILENNVNSKAYDIPDEILQKRAITLDICYSDSTRSCCFTKSYGRYVTGTGSVYTSNTKKEVDSVYEELKNYQQDTPDYLNCIKQLQLRFFTPREVSRLMCFPETFNFPESVSDRQKYMLLGNSINIKVVSELIKLLVN